MESGYLFFALVSIVVGLSIQEMFNFSRIKEHVEDTMIKEVHDIAPETVVAAIEQINQEVEKQVELETVVDETIPVDKRNELFEAVDKQDMLEAVDVKPESVAETIPADVSPSDEISVVETVVNEEVVAVEVEPVVFIENVLPLPKKHVKKTFEYQYDISSELMEFDHEVSEEDDFDL